jgi:hypothetical protein
MYAALVLDNLSTIARNVISLALDRCLLRRRLASRLCQLQSQGTD